MKTAKQKREARAKRLQNLAKDYGVYLLCFSGVLITQIVPNLLGQFLAGGDIIMVTPTWGRVGASAIVAMIVMFFGERTKDIEGRRANFGRRGKAAFMAGISCLAWLERIIGEMGN